MQMFELPWPPSINHYYRNVRGRIIISKEGRQYRERIGHLLAASNAKIVDGPIAMGIDFYPPDSRRRDLDNVQKALWDALQHGGLYRDDSQIKRFCADMREPMPPHGMCIVSVRPKEEL
jgi:Holliday junction resolvase RusA-like endonuclease